MAEKRKDSKGRVLKIGESERANGTYSYRWVTRDGKRHNIYAKTLSELRQKEDEATKDKLDNIKIVDKNVTVNNVYEMWKNLKRGLKDNTFQNYCYMYDQFVKPSFGNRKICDLKKSDVRRFYISLKENSGLKISSIDNIHTVLHQVIGMAVDDCYLRSNVSDGALTELKKTYNDSIKRNALTIAESKSFINFIKNHYQYDHWYPIFLLFLETGMRVGEITGLRWEDINFDEGYISINHTLVYYQHSQNKCYFGINTPKTKAGERIIPLTKNAVAALEAEREYQSITNLSCNVSVDGYTNFVFINRFGNVHNQGTINKAIKRIVRDHNLIALENETLLLPNFSCHHLRHTFATRLCESGLNIKAIQEILGHADISTTMDVYAEATKEFKIQEIEKFESLHQI